MSDRPRIGLDNSAFYGRLRQPANRVAPLSSGPIRQPFGPRVNAQPTIAASNVAPTISQPNLSAPQQYRPDVRAAQLTPATVPPRPTADVFKMVAPQPFAVPAHPKQQQSQVLHRQAVRNPAVKPEKSTVRHSKMQLAMVGMAVFVFGVGLFVSLITVQTNHTAKTQVAALASHAKQVDGAVAPNAPPAEDKPTTTNMGTYHVAPDLPQQIIIPKLYVYARVRSMSVNDKNELQAPGNIYDAGWYNASAKPGSGAGSGAMLIDGHVHGPSQPGVFVNIKKLVAGDDIQVLRGDGKTFHYSVVKVQNVDAANLDIGASLTSATPGKPALNLITCGGPYDKQTGEYTQRTLVFAVQTDLTTN